MNSEVISDVSRDVATSRRRRGRRRSSVPSKRPCQPATWLSLGVGAVDATAASPADGRVTASAETLEVAADTDVVDHVRLPRV